MAQRSRCQQKPTSGKYRRSRVGTGYTLGEDVEFTIATRASWKDLEQLRMHILNGTETTAVKNVKKLLMKGLADAIEIAEWRSDAKDGDASGNKLMVTINLSVRPNGRRTAGPENARSGISLIAQLDDALTEKKTTRKKLLGW
jgi:hypothetical protein